MEYSQKVSVSSFPHINSTKPSVSIIIVTLNADSVIEKCIRSVLAQSCKNIELIIIDGGSRDGTADIIKKYEDGIGYWTSEPDEGIYDAMNKALAHISSDWVYFLGADDELLPEFSSLLQEIKDHNTIYYGSVLKENKKYLGKMNPYQIAKTNICHQATIYPASVFKKYNFDLKFAISADHVLNMLCWKDEQYKFEFVDYIIARFNHTGVSSLTKDKLFESRKGRLILENFGWKIWLRFVFKRFKESFKTRPALT